MGALKASPNDFNCDTFYGIFNYLDLPRCVGNDPLNTENSFLLKFSFLIIRYGKRNKCDFTLILFSYVFPFSPFRSQSYIFALFTMCPPVLSPVCFSFCCMYFFFSHELHSYHLIVLFFLIQTAKGLTNDILIYLNFTR